jgi:hypothetical protein
LNGNWLGNWIGGRCWNGCNGCGGIVKGWPLNGNWLGNWIGGICTRNGNVFGNEGNGDNCICGVCICGICVLNAKAVCAAVVVVVSAANTRIAGPTIIFIISYHVLIPLNMNKSLISINLTCLRFCLQWVSHHMKQEGWYRLRGRESSS